MPDWSQTMEQTFEYYVVDPGTWKNIKKINTVTDCSISRDESTDTLGSATIDMDESVGECYIRVYLITIQNGVREEHPLGTFLVQSPSSDFDGKKRKASMDAYTPLIELKEKQPEIGYAILAESNDGSNVNIMEMAAALVDENVRAPVIPAVCNETLHTDFVASPDETWITFLSDLIYNAKYTFGLDELGRVIFLPRQDIASLQPVWTYDDGNSSILRPDVTLRHDIYNVPNVVEVVYTNGANSHYAIARNDDPNSPTSTVSRGRIIKHRDTNPSLAGVLTQPQVQDYAERLLSDLSTVEYELTYSHAYNGVRVGDCVRFNYSRADLSGIKAKVVNQNIRCKPGCEVSETAVFTSKLWR